jgi:chromosome segregation protein
MYLSKIEIIGFKSFAQRVNVNFDTGVTAIVGPNGCGKTNIVDAIRWALGEQRYSTLRSDKMEDVIFNGTKSRKPLGLAEVSLTIENTKGILPTEYSEVTITRRVFRSGESEYLLNKVPCRLKDILDLFMDTGMGSDAYSVIELKMVETILSDKTDERRKLFEEAAGVTKYKVRRKAAYRKLESVQQDLTRVNDIVKEVEKTVNSLERQAKKAEQYNDVSKRLKSLEVDLLEREYAHLHGRLHPLEEKFTLARTDKMRINEVLQSQESYLDSLRTGLNEIEGQLTTAQRSASSQLEIIHHVEEKILIANERRNSLTLNIERYEKEKTDLVVLEEQLTQEKASLQTRQGQHQQELSVSEGSYARLKEEQQAAGAQLETKRTEVQTHKDAILSLAHEVVQKRGEQERLKARTDNLRGRADRSNEDNELYRSDVKQNEEKVAQLTAEDKELRRRFVEAEMQLYEKEKTKKQLKEEGEKLQQIAQEIRNDSERKSSKIEFLKRLIESNEGYSEGAKYLLGSDQWKQKKLVTVADLIHAQEKYRVAVGAALGDVANYLVVERSEDIFAAIEELRRQDKGKTTFVCLQWIPKIQRRRKHKKNNPFLLASSLVTCKAAHRSLINFLLDDVVVVEHLQQARDLQSKVIGARCVTLDGQIVSSTGVVRGGSQRVDEGGLLGKKSQIAELEQEVTALQEKRKTIEGQQTQNNQRFEAVDVKSHADLVKTIEKEMTAIEMRIAQLEFEKRRANDGIERNKSEIDNLQKEMKELDREHEVVGAGLGSLEERKAGLELQAHAAAQELGVLENQWNEKTKSVNELEIKVVTLQSDLRNVERDIDRADARMQDVGVTLARRDEEIARAVEEITRLSSELELTNEELGTLRMEFESIENSKRNIEQSYSTKRNELHAIELKLKDERRLHDDSVTTAHELEMKISELKSNIEHLKLRAVEEFELGLQLKTYPEDEWVDFAQLREEVKNLKDRIRVLGAINFAAFDEFTAESERLTFLTQQRDDLLEAEKTLVSTIEEINNTAQRKFLDTFGKIRENFITIFKELFMEGDECDLRIEEGIDPLEANIEIIAKPRGKRPTSIDLLSGGEKTLTAIALLFAIYLVKPSPFCILDEVDAPLDDSNIDRYTKILKKFSGNTQFIVVTHNKRTMEAAHALYGITMEEEGVSKIVTVRFNEEARVRSATVAGGS